jgi:hypothetical protein
MKRISIEFYYEKGCHYLRSDSGQDSVERKVQVTDQVTAAFDAD